MIDGGGQDAYFVLPRGWHPSLTLVSLSKWKVSRTLIAYWSHTYHDPVKYKVAMGAAQSAPVPHLMCPPFLQNLSAK